MISRRLFLQGLGATAFSSMSTAAYAIGVEPFRMRVKEHHLTPPNWPKNIHLKAALIADPHICDPWMGLDRVRFIVERTNALNPDIVLMLGDYVASHRWQSAPVPAQAWADLFATFDAPLGTHAILGNHDWWDDGAAQLSGRGPTKYGKALMNAGIDLYQNRAVRLSKDGRAFWLAGLDDQLALAPNRKLNRRHIQGVDDLAGTLGQVTDDAPVVLMAHEPDIFRTVPPRVSVTLSGHTHGGQINCFGLKPFKLIKPDENLAYGHIVDTAGPQGARHLVVSGGLGCSFLPMRLGVPPEITLVHLGGNTPAAAA